jgi:hypothetical protein
MKKESTMTNTTKTKTEKNFVYKKASTQDTVIYSVLLQIESLVDDVRDGNVTQNQIRENLIKVHEDLCETLNSIP